MTDLFRQPTTGGATQELLLADRAHKFAQDVSLDGRYLVYVSSPTQSTADLMLLSLADKKASPYVKNAANARIHPNGRWVAYATFASGRPEICIESFPTPGAKSQISNGGGDVPVWSRDGKELYYQAGGKLLVVQINGETGTPSGPAVALFDLPVGTSARLNVAYDVARNGRFLFNVPVDSERPRALVTLNWKPVLSGPALR